MRNMKDKEGNMVTDESAKMKRWRMYFEKLDKYRSKRHK